MQLGLQGFVGSEKLHSRLSMFRAEHHWVTLQLMPGG